jgi:alpha-mannosidase
MKMGLFLFLSFSLFFMLALTTVQGGNKQRRLHLISNAHIDPVWLWEWQEGVAAAVSTFRTAADLCEEFDGYVFNHNEAILYQWIEEYDPALFSRIQRLVKQGQWHIMGGWYLQPDCNMPSGESFVRQILLGRRYFQAKFAVTPTTAINFDPFGHTRGLVQIMAKSGYDSYLFCRPEKYPLPDKPFIWEGYDGSTITALRPWGFYISRLGQVDEKVKQFWEVRPDESLSLLLWGVGNHGGGPSRLDLQKLAAMQTAFPESGLGHSTPEAFFAEVKKAGQALEIHRDDLNPSFPGCYTSQIRIKQKHRQLENELFATEKMATTAWSFGLMAYPGEAFQEAMRVLANSEFHDILPGSSIQPVEETSLRLLEHGLELLSRVKARAFFALAQGQPKAGANEIPILVYNPHPFPVRQTIECEFQLADQNWDGTFTQITVFQNGQPLPTQVEQELSHLNLDWRKRVVFAAELAPAQMNRFDCRLQILPQKPVPHNDTSNILFKNELLEVVINRQTGLLDRYRVRGVDYLRAQAGKPLVIQHNEDSWGTDYVQFRDQAGEFGLLSPQASARFAGVKADHLEPVRVIEDGAARMVIEALFGYNHSFLCQQYIIPKQGTEIEIATRVLWNEKDRMLKLAWPVAAPGAAYYGQVAYGVQKLPDNGNECVAQKWVGAVSSTDNKAVTIINNGIYGSDFADGEIRLSLLRSPAYSSLKLGQRPLIADQNRLTPRMDQGERLYKFWINAGPVSERMQSIDREALARNETPMVLSFFPGGSGQAQAKPFLSLDDQTIVLTAMKKAEGRDAMVLRFFEPTGKKRKTTVSIPSLQQEKLIEFSGFEIKSFLIDAAVKEWQETDLMEHRLH